MAATSRRGKSGRPAVSTHRRPPEQPAGQIRLQKVMAAAGVASRRHCEEMILAGRVEVDGRVVTQLGTCVDPATQQVRVDGQTLRLSRHVYYLVNKPEGVVSTNYDPAGRPRVIDLVPETSGHLFTVGRLDLSSEGLILVTNDGDLANRLAHPRFGVKKTYLAQVAGQPTPDVLATLRQGVRLAEGRARVASVRVRKQLKQSTLLEVILAEGKNREIRRILAKVGHKVLRLKRVAIGPLKLEDLPPGGCRRLSSDQVDQLRRVARGLPVGKKRRKAPPGGGSRPSGQPKRGMVERTLGRSVIGGGGEAAPRGERPGPRKGRRPPASSPRRPRKQQ